VVDLVPALPVVDQHQPVEFGSVRVTEGARGASAELVASQHLEFEARAAGSVEADPPDPVSSAADRLVSARHLPASLSSAQDRSLNGDRES
jgi:hypothetical protein